jgi:hypothetical protein
MRFGAFASCISLPFPTLAEEKLLLSSLPRLQEAKTGL